MLSDVPNFAFAFGYTNLAWTLKVDLVWKHFCRLLDYMDENKYGTFTPVISNKNMKRIPFVDLNSGYIQRSIAQFPMAGTQGPWIVKQDYKFDVERLHKGSVFDKELLFSNPQIKKKLHVITEEPLTAQIKIQA